MGKWNAFRNMKVGNVLDDAWDMVSGKTLLNSNKAINSIPKVFDNFAGAGQYIGEGVRTGDWGKAAETVFKKDGKLNAGKIAGSFIGASAAARVATGGGITKDRHGNSNIIGVPFM